VIALPALQAGNGPVGGTRTEGLGVGVGDALANGLDDAVGLGLGFSFGVGAAKAGLLKNASVNDALAASAAENLK